MSEKLAPGDALERLIARLVDGLFTNGLGQTADRLVLTVDSQPPCDLGGWGRGPITDRIRDVLAAVRQPSPAEKTTTREEIRAFIKRAFMEGYRHIYTTADVAWENSKLRAEFDYEGALKSASGTPEPPAAPSQELFASRFGPTGLYRNNGDTFRDGYVAALADVQRESVGADAQLRATLAEMVKTWRAQKAQTDGFHATMGTGYRACADALDAALRQEERP